VGLVQLVRFLVVELIRSNSNPRFDMGVIFTVNYFFVGGDVSVDSDVLLVIDFVNLKIKSAQSFRCAYSDRKCVCIFIGMSAHIYISICVLYCVLKKRRSGQGEIEACV
jgi:hypothetical protein